MRALLALVAMAGVAAAEPAVDPNAQASGSEANLESIAPRDGMTYAGSIGGGMIISQGKSAAVPTLDLRLGHVATPTTIITLELVGGTYAHKEATMGSTHIDTQTSLLVGAQVYIAPSVWVRGGVGLGSHNTDDGTGLTPHGGLSGIFGAGVDLVRWHYWVLGLEGFVNGTFAKGGYTSLGGMGFGLAHY